jgi:hypothetical protein
VPGPRAGCRSSSVQERDHKLDYAKAGQCGSQKREDQVVKCGSHTQWCAMVEEWQEYVGLEVEHIRDMRDG